MIATDEDMLICDLAETYRIYDYRSLPVDLVATFCCGLRDNSRIKSKINGLKVSFETLLLAKLVDNTSWLVWAQTEDAKSGKNRPTSLAALLSGREEEKENISFASGDEFDKYRQSLINGGH